VRASAPEGWAGIVGINLSKGLVIEEVGEGILRLLPRLWGEAHSIVMDLTSLS
jgi:hypothetical protein